jgi:hypothetical protein
MQELQQSLFPSIKQSQVEIIFSSRAEGMGFDGVTVSSHRDYMEYENFVGKIKDLETL